jgi:predicted O-linked N-acetylglucosamine transferase (SPINDLY family)
MLRDFLNRLLPARRLPVARVGAGLEEAAERLIADGNRAEREGRLREACELYHKGVDAAPGYARAHLNLGIGLEAVGEADAALAAYEAALAIDPDDPYVNYNLGRLLCTRGALERAERLLHAALRHKPDFPEAQVTLSNVYDARGNPAAAAQALEGALRHQPQHPGVLRNYGMVLGTLARWTEAETALRRAVAADAADPDAVYELGNALARQDKLDGARGCYRKAIELRPRFAEAWCHLGNVLTDWGLREDAMRCLAKALEIRSDFPDALVGVGNLHAVAGRLEDAADCYRRALALEPRIPDAHVNLGHALKDMGERRDALACYGAALALKPDFAQARWSVAMLRIPVLRESDDDLSRVRAEAAAELDSLDHWFDATRAAEGHRAVGVQQPFWLAYQEEDNRDLLERYGPLCARLMACWQDQQSLKPVEPRGLGAIRVGIVSAQLREHSVWNAIVKGWFQHLDDKRFALVAFCLAPEQDAETLYASSRAARFVQMAGGLRQWVEAILEAQPDVLIYPEIGMDPMTVKLASLRLAPVQVASWGHPETTGLPTIDYFLSAEGLEPEGAQANYTERLVALPHLGCFVERARVEARVPDLGAWGIDGGVPLLLCPGTPFKYAPQHDWIFPEIARRLTRCRFIFFTHRLAGLSQKLSRRLEAEFARGGLDFEDFVSFIPWQDKAGFYGLMERADVFLDTIGFSGFNTALQAVECGLPIVTREGRFMRGRLASGILKRMGLTELVVPSEQDYVALAVRLARDTEYRGHIRKRIAESSHVLFEDIEPIRALEAFLAEAAEHSRAGAQAPK